MTWKCCYGELVHGIALPIPECSTTGRRNLHRTLTNTLEELEWDMLEGEGMLDGSEEQNLVEGLEEGDEGRWSIGDCNAQAVSSGGIPINRTSTLAAA